MPREKRPYRYRPVPDDFAKWARMEGNIKLKARYGSSQAVIERWRRETGIRYIEPLTPAKKSAISKVRRRVQSALYQDRRAGRIEGWDDYDPFEAIRDTLR